MNQDIKDRWLALIESGEYNMGKNMLYRFETDEHCPLGVLVEMAIEAGAYEPKTTVQFNHRVLTAGAMSLTREIREWAGVTSAETQKVADYNDHKGLKAATSYIRGL